MTSIERKEARYKRRKAAREAAKLAKYGEFDNYEAVFSYEHLYRSYQHCRKGVAWKASVQKYITQAPLNVHKAYMSLMKERYKSPGFYEFDLYERGKKRHIRSTVIAERVVQHCLCDYAIVPMVSRTFIYDNGASMKRRGYDFAVRRITQHLHEHYRKYGQEGYVLLFDFSKFFDNVSHEVVKGIFRKEFTDERLIKIANHLIDVFGDKGLGLGSQISQVMALASANRVDHYVKEMLRIHAYGRYMDDGYLIHQSKEYLHECLAKIQVICDELGITLNRKKTQIVKLSHGFTWLKVRFFLTSKGKVIKRIHRSSVTRMRRRFKKLYPMFVEGRITLEDVNNSWQSWRSHAMRFSSYHTIMNAQAQYERLFLLQEG